MNVKLKDTEKIKINGPDEIYPIMQRILMRENKIDRDREHYWVLGLDTSNKLLYIEMIGLGTINKVLVEPMEVYSLALQKRSVSIVVVHNHPSGNLTPSDSDKRITDQLIQVGEFLRVPVLDSLIISEKSYYSFLESGLFEQLKNNSMYKLPYKEQQQLLSNAEELGRKQREKEIAREMKARGTDPEIIAAVTGLTVEEIKKLKLRKTNEA